MAKRILIVEDIPQQLADLVAAFKEAGFETLEASKKWEGYQLGMDDAVDGAVVDLELPDEDLGGNMSPAAGLDIIRRWRKENREFPVIIVTAANIWLKGEKALDIANVYIEKPHKQFEVIKTMRGYLEPPWINKFEFPPYTFYLGDNRLVRNGVEVDLGTREKQVLRILLEQAGRTVSTEQLLAKIYGDEVPTNNTIHQAIRGIRRAIGESAIATIRKEGYRFELKVSAISAS